MLPEDVKKLNISLARFLSAFEDCFDHSASYKNFTSYIRGQVSDLPRKNVRQIAMKEDVPVRTLQGFLDEAKWDEQIIPDKIQSYVRRKHTGEENIGVLDCTYFSKQGDETACVARQWNGEKGKKGNCVVSVNLSFCSKQFHTLLDTSLYVPKEWIQDQDRRKRAGIPASISYRSTQKIAVDQVRRARSNQLPLDWISFDEEFGKSPTFLEELEQMNQSYVGEVPRTCSVWTNHPNVIDSAEEWPKRGRRPEFPTVDPDAPDALQLNKILDHPEVFHQSEWQPVHIKDTCKGPKVWEIKTASVYHKREGLPSEKRLLILARSPFTGEMKYFLAYNPGGADLSTLIRVAFSRFPIELCFREGKQEVGMGDFEVRKYPALKRHLLISMISHLFISDRTDRLNEFYPDLTKPQLKRAVDAMIQTAQMSPRRKEKRLEQVCEKIRYTQKRNKASYQAHEKKRKEELEEMGYEISKMLSCVRKDE